MDDSGMSFYKKDENQDQNNEQARKIEYSGGGGGGGKPIVFTKSSSFSRVCYSDPNNPGKMICKSSNAKDIFDGNKKRHYRHETPEEIYDNNNNFFGNYNIMNNPPNQYNNSNNNFDRGKLFLIKKIMNTYYREVFTR